jgi:hypothetical protein
VKSLVVMSARSYRGATTLIRHAARCRPLPCAVPSLSGGMETAPTLGGLVPAVGHAVALLASLRRARRAAVPVAPVAPPADDDLIAASIAQEQAGGLRVSIKHDRTLHDYD